MRRRLHSAPQHDGATPSWVLEAAGTAPPWWSLDLPADFDEVAETAAHNARQDSARSWAYERGLSWALLSRSHSAPNDSDVTAGATANPWPSAA